MECKEVCIPGEVQAPLFEKKNCSKMCLCFADCLYDSNRGVTGGKKRQVRVGEGTENEREM